MRKRQHVILLLGLLSATALAAPRESRPTSFDVRDFGAQGDGRADDTKAIQAAFDAAAKKTWSEQPPGSAYFISIPTVFIPAGKYLITETIDLKANLLGEGTAIVEQKNAEKDVFSSPFAWRLQVSGLTLHWHRGAFVWNRNAEGRWTPGGFVKATTPGDQEPFGWSCAESGKPGTWRAVYPNFAADIKEGVKMTNRRPLSSSSRFMTLLLVLMLGVPSATTREHVRTGGTICTVLTTTWAPVPASHRWADTLAMQRHDLEGRSHRGDADSHASSVDLGKVAGSCRAACTGW